MMHDYQYLFQRSLSYPQNKFHFAAHSHHLWPDASEQGQQLAWQDAAALADLKWEHIFAEVMPQAEAYITDLLNITTQQSLVFAPNTHELIVRLLSTFPPGQPIKILTTDSEFYSASRQMQRLEEAGLCTLVKIPVEPFATFADRFLEHSGTVWDMIFFSQVFFNSGFALTQAQLETISNTFSVKSSMIVVDGYHAFMARPTSLQAIEDKVFYLAGGYKYAMAGEGVCFMHVPSKVKTRPMNTGWFAGFEDLAHQNNSQVSYPAGGRQFAGSTFDPSGLYRFNAVQQMLRQEGIQVTDIHEHVNQLQQLLVELLTNNCPKQLVGYEIVPAQAARGHFITLRLNQAQDIADRFIQNGVVLDSRVDRLRFGLGMYHTSELIHKLWQHLQHI